MPAVDAPKVTPLEGKTTLDDKMVFEPERLSYQSADRLAKKIAHAVQKDLNGQTVVIVGTAFLADLTNLQAVRVKLEGLKRDYEALAQQAETITKLRFQPSPEVKAILKEFEKTAVVATEVLEAAGAAVLSPVTVGVSTAIGFVSLFREDVNYRGIQTVVNPLAFELALAAKVKAGGATRVFVPDLVVLQPPQAETESIQGRLEAVQKAKARVWETVGPLVSELVRLDAELDCAAREKNQELVNDLSRRLASLRKDLDPVTEPLRQVDQRFSDLQTSWDKTDAESGLTMLARLLRAESIQAMNPRPRYLHALVVSSGGHNRTSHSLFRMIFSGDGLSFMGGATARWAMLENDGSVASGGIASERVWGRFPSMFDASENKG